VVLVATNYHVIASPAYEDRGRLTPQEVARSFQQVQVAAVFNSGTRAEETCRAEPIAADVDNDLAILRISGLKDRPVPLDYRTQTALVETTPVYMFGFPFGNRLSLSKGNPTLTVGKGIISSIRYDDRGDLAYVQIDGAINPGNSGGPVVDARGRVVGVAVARVRDGEGIGLAVPGIDLIRLMKGRVCGMTTVVGRSTGNKLSVRTEVEVADPLRSVREVTLNYLVLPRGARWPDGPLERQAGAQKITLRVNGPVASGEVAVDPSDGVLLLQAVPQGGAGAEGATVIRRVSLQSASRPAGPRPSGPLGPPPGPSSQPPPQGWRAYTSPENTYTVWLPVGAASRSERAKSVRGRVTKFVSVSVTVPNGPLCSIDQVIIEGASTAESRAEVESAILGIMVRELQGRVIAQVDGYSGYVPGREYLIASAHGFVRLRLFVAGNWIIIVQVIGSRPMVEGTGAQTYLDSFRLHEETAPGHFGALPPDQSQPLPEPDPVPPEGYPVTSPPPETPAATPVPSSQTPAASAPASGSTGKTRDSDDERRKSNLPLIFGLTLVL
jgi:S1-C subfamily serine protease